ncbi:hypothetical protein BSZ36_10095 [Rubricoccus marinus]|uniref:Four helix bundle protein n=1 Tax=Rubricoccus marinus TaxID=716817 RepID=A0A259TZW3_9BACT|nr:hypothetical protein BSZ36_10095 [Rubricoccus marinus]
MYGDARALAREIYALSKAWPREERYSLTDQIRRASRSVMANTAEAWRKRRYPKHFASKLSDAEAEACECRAWLDVALDCGHVDAATHNALDVRYHALIGGLVTMQRDSARRCSLASGAREPVVGYDTARGSEFPV